MSQHLFKKLSGPPAYQTIVTSPHRQEIDERLFTQRESALSVHRWIVEELAVTNITYASLNRYKNARLKLTADDEGDLRKAEIIRDLRYLSSVIRLGKGTLQAGLAVRPSEAMRAIELRANLLTLFPDASPRRENEIIAEFERFVNVVRDHTTPEQHATILARLNETSGGNTDA